MRVLLDMNLSPALAEQLRRSGIEARHWSELGAGTATDSEIAQYARAGEWVILSHDLDFSAILAATRQSGPSVIQVRCKDTMSAGLPGIITAVLQQFASELQAGALISITAETRRVRLLPLKPAT